MDQVLQILFLITLQAINRWTRLSPTNRIPTTYFCDRTNTCDAIVKKQRFFVSSKCQILVLYGMRFGAPGNQSKLSLTVAALQILTVRVILVAYVKH